MSKVEDLLAPSGDGTEDTTVVLFTLDTTARNAALPQWLYGEIIRVTPFGANVWWYISNSESASVDRTVAVSATGATAADLGSRLANGVTVERLCGHAKPGDRLYLVWQGDGAGTSLQIEKGSGRPRTVTVDI